LNGPKQQRESKAGNFDRLKPPKRKLKAATLNLPKHQSGLRATDSRWPKRQSEVKAVALNKPKPQMKLQAAIFN
jgi:hypothetical protein